MKKNITRIFLVTACAVTTLLTGSASAVTTSGDGVVIAPPASVAPGATQASDTLSIFFEGVHTVSNLAVDVATPGALPFHTANLAPGLISGTVESYLIHHDPIGPPPFGPITLSSAIAEFTFDNDILGVIFLSSTLSASEAINGLGAVGTFYPTGLPGRGLEPILLGDAFSWIPGMPNVLDVGLLTDLGIDQIRVITRTPEPSTYLTLGTLLMFAAVALQRRKVKVKA